MSESVEPTSSGLQSDFSIYGEAGKGAYGVVYKAERKLDKRIYAVKVTKFKNYREISKQRLGLVDPEKFEKGQISNFENALKEAKLLASLCHPNVVSYKEVFFDAEDEQLCLVQEYVNYGNLEQLIKTLAKKSSSAAADSEAHFPEELLWRCLIQMLTAIEHIHSKSIIHRDVKSANVFLHMPRLKTNKKDLPYSELKDI